MNRMRFRQISLLIVLGVLLSSCTSRSANENKPAAQTGVKDPRLVRTSADVVKLNGSGAALPAGASADLPIPIAIEPGYHINANPATFDYLIATELTVDKSDGITFGKPVYPTAETRKFRFAEEPLAVYEGNVQIKLPVQSALNATKGNRTLSVRVRVQACDEEKCFPPDTLKAEPFIDLK